MQELCFGWLVNLLRVESIRDSFKDNVFIPGKKYDETIQEYLRNDEVNFLQGDYHTSNKPYLGFKNFIPLEDSLRR